VEEKKRRRVLVSFCKTLQSLFPVGLDVKHESATRVASMGAWYTIGIVVGLGAAVGILVAAFVPRVVVTVVVAVAAGVVIGFLAFGWPEAVGGAIGGALGGVGATPVVAGALRRGGTRSGTAVLVAAAALVVAGLAFVPVVGYLEALVLPALGLRLRRREPDRHAGLRTLARD
jgi:hypothetical protein